MPKALELQLPEATEQVRLFHISVPQEAIDDLRARLRATRFPNQQPVKDWSQGVPLAHAKSLIEYWESGYDWRRFETELNSFPNFRTSIDGLGIHFIHVRSPHLDALPIVLTHGWPGSIVEFMNIIRPLRTRLSMVVAHRMRSMLFNWSRRENRENDSKSIRGSRPHSKCTTQRMQLA